MTKLCRYTPAIILVIFIIIFSWTKQPDRTWDRVINSDGKAYYAYLPAIFIYHDLQFKFVEDYESKYYPGNRSAFKEFRVPSGEKVVNKTFPGLAIVWMPFFLAGHVIALVEMFPADGYSLPYQYAIAFSALFFLWLGAWLLMKLLLKMGSNEKTAAFITAVVTLGTNIIYYTVVEGTMSHVYSFALIAAFLFSSWNILHRFSQRWFTLSLLLYVLICLIRPTNGLVIILVPFLAGTIEDVLSLINDIILLGKKIIWSILPALVLVFLPFLLWKLQTGQWIVYTYGEERLHPLHPNIINILFSYNRGWFVYTPVAFISLFGFIGLFRKNKFSFYFLFSFLFLFIYVASCWWVWYYASKCGQRIFVDIYAITGILLFYLYDLLRYRFLKWILSFVLVAAIVLNIFQFYQHRNWIYPPTIITKAIFCDSFFSTERKAKVYIPAEAVVSEKSFKYDMEKYTDWQNSPLRFSCS